MSGHYRDQLADQPLGVEIVDEALLHSGFRDFKKLTIEHDSLEGGARIGPMEREYLATGAVAVIVPYDPQSDSIVVIRQFRLAASLATPNAAAVELPAGMVDAGENVAEAAARELEEETGLAALAIERCFSMLPSPGLTDEHAHIFLAIVDASHLGISAGKDEEHEDIRPILAPVEDLIAAVDDGRVLNGYLIACTHWFARKGRARAQALQGSLFDSESD
ncbi:NUDIX hydrolase [Aurantimonas sp. 22II-16-19i]|uniref:NUDIX domain-containing protein n=1 Tax=Aurantimonas sp. 22II-16-19i TaxID=1317114 RepID=UPI0009F7D6F1|nr:NUDIX hydrolase [Aurantimonas sp. 22II-16-19i]ORE98592.1 nucleoside diphosphate pyrophosphatase [Aurantimonas sp. 22II-16-19i]